ncbi:MAG: ROK family protein [Nitrospirales bacterium]|nr:ROK family protein [Nitrospira sp.]MDR4501445.1 ROK family protein [Nitrospirales bacterium]
MRIGIDLGGTKIEAILLAENGTELTRRRVPTPQGQYRETLETVSQLVREIEREFCEEALVGIGIPGTISPATGLVKNANSICLIGHRLQEDLEGLLRRPVRIANDADCFTASEATDGAAAGVHLVFGVILGTGVGGGVCWQGQVLRGPNAITGEWGHNPLPWPEDDERPGTPCYCGRSGCLETFLSGSGLQRAYKQLTEEDASPQDIYHRSRQGDVRSEQALRLYGSRLARGLASVINLLDPDVIVLGGGLSNVKRWYEEVPKIWGKWIFSDRVETKLVPAKHGDSSGVRGAAWLWPASSFKEIR